MVDSRRPLKPNDWKWAASSINIVTDYSVSIGLIVRLLLAWLLPFLLDNERFIPGVAYTDIDFHVFSDAAAYVQQGESPYRRTTYRYTPFLAVLLATLPSKEAGRYLFCVADAICGWIILLYRRRNRTTSTSAGRGIEDTKRNGNTASSDIEEKKLRLMDAGWWLYNPLSINICTRGSAESLVVLLPVLCTLWVASSVAKQYTKGGFRVCVAAVASGISHGVAIHAKLYPVIYTLSFMTSFVQRDGERTTSKSTARAWHSIVWLWTKRLLSPAPILFAGSAFATFVGLTYGAVRMYGDTALQEGLLYHFSRVDHRHNYSIHWYWIYLARDRVDTNAAVSMAWIGRVQLVPQLILLAYTSLGIAPHNLSLALFVQTFLFVAHNKVITAQYFTWYLCLLPLCSDGMQWTRRVGTALLFLGVSIITWLGSAYCLEMQGMAVHRVVWMASLIFFVANVNLLGALLASTQIPKTVESSKRD